MAKYIAGYNGAKFIDLTKGVDLEQDGSGKVYLVDREGQMVGNGVTIQSSSQQNMTLTVYDDVTGEISTVNKNGEFTYEDVED